MNDPGDEDLSGDDTPTIDADPFYTKRAGRMDWSRHTGAKNRARCIYHHGTFETHGRFDIVTNAIISKDPCPQCGTHHMGYVALEHHRDEIV
jgi:hypothetical protein